MERSMNQFDMKNDADFKLSDENKMYRKTRLRCILLQ